MKVVFMRANFNLFLVILSTAVIQPCFSSGAPEKNTSADGAIISARGALGRLEAATSADSPLPSAPTNPYFTGDGGKGMRLAVLEPTGNGLSTQEQWVLSQVQGSIAADFNRFSPITIIDRQNLEKVLAEQKQSLSGNYSEQDFVRLGNLTNASHILTGTIRKTANNYMLELAVTDVEKGERRASYSPKAVSLIALENNSAAREATADMLKQLGVNLTAAALQELKTVENNTAKIQAENALARGIAAQRQGTEVAALSYFFQATAFDPTLVEAANRSSVLAANISSGNIGEDARNEIQWRRNWATRLTETEQYFNNYFDNFFKTASPYTLFYTTEIKQGSINFQNETVTLSIETNLHASSEWLGSVESVLRSMQSSIKAVQNGLAATGRAAIWGLDKWPQQDSFNLKPFGKQNKNFTVIFELVNSKNQVIGRQTLETAGSYEISAPMPGARTTISVSADDRKTVTFTNVKADDITDNLTIRIASVNGVNAESVARNGVLQVSPLSADEWNSFHNSTYSVVSNYSWSPRSNETGDSEKRNINGRRSSTDLFADDARFWSIGVSAGTSFAAPFAIGTIRGTIAPFKYSFLELGLDYGMISGIADAENYYSLYPFAHYNLFLPFTQSAGWYAGAGGGYMLGEYTFPEEKIPVRIFALDATTGINLWNMVDVSYTLRTDFKSANSKVSIGYTYRFK